MAQATESFDESLRASAFSVLTGNISQALSSLAGAISTFMGSDKSEVNIAVLESRIRGIYFGHSPQRDVFNYDLFGQELAEYFRVDLKLSPSNINERIELLSPLEAKLKRIAFSNLYGPGYMALEQFSGVLVRELRKLILIS